MKKTLHPEFEGRPVQVLRVKPALILDLLRDLVARKLSWPAVYRNLDGARVVGCHEFEGLVWLYLEKEGWPLLPPPGTPYVTHLFLLRDGELQLTNEWSATP